MSSAIQDLLDILDLEPLEVNLFRGRSPQSRWQRVFGGQVIGQALVAACRTVEDVATRPPHSLHAYFLLGGDPKVPIIYEVDRIRDGTSFTTRRVVAIQHGHAIFSMSVSFHVAEAGFSHQAKMPDVPQPDAAAERGRAAQDRMLPLMPEPVRRYYERERPIELRPVEFDRYLGKQIRGRPLPRLDPRHRAAARRSGDPPMRARLCVRHDAARRRAHSARPHRVRARRIMAASLDHALWFHRPFRADEWLLYAQDSPTLAGARGFSRGLIFASDGTLVASVAQEGLMRERREAGHRRAAPERCGPAPS